ncbi:hypothetical protein [Pseudoalteromonas ostreae]|uniref:hypothetical protein n=1 Tax=Pseudoalteromonas ostreae TaxID=2774154 RepID=UPI001B379209|nr:hypothetical protein [Pseudoalteromonas ostreae]
MLARIYSRKPLLVAITTLSDDEYQALANELINQPAEGTLAVNLKNKLLLRLHQQLKFQTF